RERDKQASDLAQVGRASEEVMSVNIERVREQMRAVGATSRVKGPVTLDQVYDFSFVKKAYDDIRASKWDPMRYEYSKRYFAVGQTSKIPLDSPFANRG